MEKKENQKKQPKKKLKINPNIFLSSNRKTF